MPGAATHHPVDAPTVAVGAASEQVPATRRARTEETAMTTLDHADDTGAEAQPADPDPAALEAFGDRMVGMLGEACTALLTSIGHQTGLFDALAATGPATSDQVATTAGLDERYVREWLNGLTVARVVDHDPESRRYRLPAEHAAWLTTEAGPNNLARTMQFVPMLAEVEQGIVECFRNGGGLSYDHYPRFHALMDSDSREVVDASLVDVVVPLVEGLDERLRAGIDVADVGCGSGHAINVLARAYPASRLVGYDFSEEAIGRARAEAESLGLTNARFEVLDVATLDAVRAFDLVTAFDAIHDQAHPGQVLAAVARALRPEGTFLMVDVKAATAVDDNLDNPFAPALYTLSTMHCMTVSLGLGGDGLGTAWGRELATSMLHDVGFTQVGIREVEDDPFNDYYVCRPS
jgi:SAM-dependent methyltransferase